MNQVIIVLCLTVCCVLSRKTQSEDHLIDQNRKWKCEIGFIFSSSGYDCYNFMPTKNEKQNYK